MPMLIEYIDAIARNKNRDVLFASFESEESSDLPTPVGEKPLSFNWLHQDWENHSVRKRVTEWLDENGIGWQPCDNFADPNVMFPYMRKIHIDVPCDNDLPEYRKLEAFFENQDGSMRLPSLA